MAFSGAPGRPLGEERPPALHSDGSHGQMLPAGEAWRGQNAALGATRGTASSRRNRGGERQTPQQREAGGPRAHDQAGREAEDGVAGNWLQLLGPFPGGEGLRAELLRPGAALSGLWGPVRLRDA